jgi:MFS superfamily sulfate permease-like transporter
LSARLPSPPPDRRSAPPAASSLCGAGGRRHRLGDRLDRGDGFAPTLSIQRREFWLAIVCFAGVAVFGAIQGIGLAVVIAVIEFLWDGWRPHSAVLGSVEGVRGYHDITRYPDARQMPGLLLFRWDAPLFFAYAEFFKERVLDAVASSAMKVKWVVVAAQPVTRVDVTAADSLVGLDETR